MSCFSVVHGLWCVDTSLLAIDGLRAYVKTLQTTCTAQPQDDQCLAYGLTVGDGKPRLVQLLMQSSTYIVEGVAVHEGAYMWSWNAYAQYDELTCTWVYERQSNTAATESLPRQTVKLSTPSHLRDELVKCLQLDPPTWLVWPLQLRRVRMEYRLGNKRRDRIPTPLQSTGLGFEKVEAPSFDSIIPSPPSEGDGICTEGCGSSSEGDGASTEDIESLPLGSDLEGNAIGSPRKPSGCIYESDDDATCHLRDRSRSPPHSRRRFRRAPHSGSETESCPERSPSLGSPELHIDD